MTVSCAASSESDAKSESGFRIVVLLLVALIWSGVTSALDFVIGRDAFHQWRAQSYSTTTGTITASHINEEESSVYPEIRYRYVVAGTEYEGNRYRYEMQWNNVGNGARVVDAYPVKSKVAVHYDAANPSDAVLEAGLDGRNAFLLMATLPFNLLFVGLWVWFVNEIYFQKSRIAAGGAKVWDDGEQIRVRLAEWPPIVTAWGVAFGLSFAALFLVGIPFDFNPPQGVMPVVFAVIFVGAAIAFVRRSRKLAQGDYDFVIDSVGRSLTFPRSIGGTGNRTLKIESVLSVEVESLESRDAQGYLKHSRYAPTLVFTDRDGTTRREKLAEWSNKLVHRATCRLALQTIGRRPAQARLAVRKKCAPSSPGF